MERKGKGLEKLAATMAINGTAEGLCNPATRDETARKLQKKHEFKLSEEELATLTGLPKTDDIPGLAQALYDATHPAKTN